MTAAQAIALRGALHGRLEGRNTLRATTMIAAASAILGVVAYAVWLALDDVLGRSLVAQIISVGGAAAAGAAIFAYAVLWLDLPEARQVRSLVTERFGHA
jgi:hypothetical protein